MVYENSNSPNSKWSSDELDTPLLLNKKKPIAMPTILQSAVRAVAIVVLSTFWSLATALWIIWQWWRNERGRAFFCPPPHSKPQVLENWKHNFLHANGIKLHYVETGNDRSPLMLCLHGFPEFWYSYRYQLRHFAANYHVVALDLRGYNESDKPRGVSNYDLDLLVKDVAGAIEQLGGKAILIAHDWGGGLAWQLSMTRPELIQRMVILNVPHPKALARVMRTRSRQLLKSWYMFMFQCPLLPELFMRIKDYDALADLFRRRPKGLVHGENFTDEDMEAWKYVFSKPNALTPPLNYYRASIRRAGLRNFSVVPVEVKTLIIWGEQDCALEAEGAEISLRFCKDARLVKIADASHWVQQDVPDKVNSLIEQFLDEK